TTAEGSAPARTTGWRTPRSARSRAGRRRPPLLAPPPVAPARGAGRCARGTAARPAAYSARRSRAKRPQPPLAALREVRRLGPAQRSAADDLKSSRVDVTVGGRRLEVVSGRRNGRRQTT